MSADPFGFRPTKRRPRWLIPAIVAGAVLLLIVFPAISSYNGLVDKDNDVDRAFSDIDVVEQRRFDLIPNLESLFKQSQQQEKEIFLEIARLRTAYQSASGDEKIAAAEGLDAAFARFPVLIQQQPELQSTQLARDIVTELEGTENRIAQFRRVYNEEASSYNKSVRSFPSSIFAGLFGFDRRAFYQASEGAGEAPRLSVGALG